MATVENLDIQISASMERAGAAIDSVVRKLGVLAQGIRAIGTNQGLNEFIKKSQSLSSEIENMGAKVSQSMKPIQEQAKKITKDVGQMVAELQNRYKDLGKGFSFAGTTEQMRRESDRIFNALEKAKVDMQRITLSDNIDSTQLEKAVSKVMELQNKYKSLQKTLEEGGRAYHENLSRITVQANRVRRTLQRRRNISIV